MFSSTLGNDEIDVLINVPSILTNVIDTRILVAMISRRIKLESINGKFVIDASRVPDAITCEDDVGQSVHFNLTWGAHIHVRQASQNGRKEEMVSIGSNGALETTIAARGLMNKGAKSTVLGCRMDGMTFSKIRVLVHNNHGWATLGMDKSKGLF